MSNPTDSRAVELTNELRHAIHEINNALTPILANAQLVRMLVDRESEAHEAIEDVVNSASRANAIVASMRETITSLQAAIDATETPDG